MTNYEYEYLRDGDIINVKSSRYPYRVVTGVKVYTDCDPYQYYYWYDAIHPSSYYDKSNNQFHLRRIDFSNEPEHSSLNDDDRMDRWWDWAPLTVIGNIHTGIEAFTGAFGKHFPKNKAMIINEITNVITKATEMSRKKANELYKKHGDVGSCGYTTVALTKYKGKNITKSSNICSILMGLGYGWHKQLKGIKAPTAVYGQSYDHNKESAEAAAQVYRDSGFEVVTSSWID